MGDLRVADWDGPWMEENLTGRVYEYSERRDSFSFGKLLAVLTGNQLRIIREITKIKKELEK